MPNPNKNFSEYFDDFKQNSFCHKIYENERFLNKKKQKICVFSSDFPHFSDQKGVEKRDPNSLILISDGNQEWRNDSQNLSHQEYARSFKSSTQSSKKSVLHRVRRRLWSRERIRRRFSNESINSIGSLPKNYGNLIFLTDLSSFSKANFASDCKKSKKGKIKSIGRHFGRHKSEKSGMKKSGFEDKDKNKLKPKIDYLPVSGAISKHRLSMTPTATLSNNDADKPIGSEHRRQSADAYKTSRCLNDLNADEDDSENSEERINNGEEKEEEEKFVESQVGQIGEANFDIVMSNEKQNVNIDLEQLIKRLKICRISLSFSSLAPIPKLVDFFQLLSSEQDLDTDSPQPSSQALPNSNTPFPPTLSLNSRIQAVDEVYENQTFKNSSQHSTIEPLPPPFSDFDGKFHRSMQLINRITLSQSNSQAQSQRQVTCQSLDRSGMCDNYGQRYARNFNNTPNKFVHCFRRSKDHARRRRQYRIRVLVRTNSIACDETVCSGYKILHQIFIALYSMVYWNSVLMRTEDAKDYFEIQATSLGSGSDEECGGCDGEGDRDGKKKSKEGKDSQTHKLNAAQITLDQQTLNTFLSNTFALASIGFFDFETASSPKPESDILQTCRIHVSSQLYDYYKFSQLLCRYIYMLEKPMNKVETQLKIFTSKKIDFSETDSVNLHELFDEMKNYWISLKYVKRRNSMKQNKILDFWSSLNGLAERFFDVGIEGVNDGDWSAFERILEFHLRLLDFLVSTLIGKEQLVLQQHRNKQLAKAKKLKEQNPNFSPSQNFNQTKSEYENLFFEVFLNFYENCFEKKKGCESLLNSDYKLLHINGMYEFDIFNWIETLLISLGSFLLFDGDVVQEGEIWWKVLDRKRELIKQLTLKVYNTIRSWLSYYHFYSSKEVSDIVAKIADILLRFGKSFYKYQYDDHRLQYQYSKMTYQEFKCDFDSINDICTIMQTSSSCLILEELNTYPSESSTQNDENWKDFSYFIKSLLSDELNLFLPKLTRVFAAYSMNEIALGDYTIIPYISIAKSLLLSFFSTEITNSTNELLPPQFFEASLFAMYLNKFMQSERQKQLSQSENQGSNISYLSIEQLQRLIDGMPRPETEFIRRIGLIVDIDFEKVNSIIRNAVESETWEVADSTCYYSTSVVDSLKYINTFQSQFFDLFNKIPYKLIRSARSEIANLYLAALDTLLNKFSSLSLVDVRLNMNVFTIWKEAEQKRKSNTVTGLLPQNFAEYISSTDVLCLRLSNLTRFNESIDSICDSLKHKFSELGCIDAQQEEELSVDEYDEMEEEFDEKTNQKNENSISPFDCGYSFTSKRNLAFLRNRLSVSIAARIVFIDCGDKILANVQTRLNEERTRLLIQDSNLNDAISNFSSSSLINIVETHLSDCIDSVVMRLDAKDRIRFYLNLFELLLSVIRWILLESKRLFRLSDYSFIKQDFRAFVDFFRQKIDGESCSIDETQKLKDQMASKSFSPSFAILRKSKQLVLIQTLLNHLRKSTLDLVKMHQNNLLQPSPTSKSVRASSSYPNNIKSKTSHHRYAFTNLDQYAQSQSPQSSLQTPFQESNFNHDSLDDIGNYYDDMLSSCDEQACVDQSINDIGNARRVKSSVDATKLLEKSDSKRLQFEITERPKTLTGPLPSSEKLAANDDVKNVRLSIIEAFDDYESRCLSSRALLQLIAHRDTSYANAYAVKMRSSSGSKNIRVPSRSGTGLISASSSYSENSQVFGSEDYTQTMLVSTLKAEDLPIHDVFTKSSDPYVVIEFSDQKHKTKVIKKSLNPTQNQTFEFGIDLKLKASQDKVKFTVYDQDLGMSDDVMGNCELSLDSLVSDLKDKSSSALRLFDDENDDCLVDFDKYDNEDGITNDELLLSEDFVVQKCLHSKDNIFDSFGKIQISINFRSNLSWRSEPEK